MSTMIEKVAKAIADNANTPFPLSEHDALHAARSAIEAMRELTPHVIRHLQMYTEIGSHICANWSGAYDCMEQYQAAMIDAALKEGQ